MTEAAFDEAYECLLQHGKEGILYAMQRGILPGSIRAYKLGAKQEGSKLAGRLLLPIRTPGGAALTWTGRVYNYATATKTKAKWLHWSPPDSSFKKSDTLAFLYEHRHAIVRRGLLTLFESPLDALVTGQYGYPSCAYMGSTMSDTQALIAASVAGVWVVWQDDDEAGNRGYARLEELSSRYGVKLHRIIDSRGDAASVASEHGAAAVKEVLDSALAKFHKRSVEYSHGYSKECAGI